MAHSSVQKYNKMHKVISFVNTSKGRGHITHYNIYLQFKDRSVNFNCTMLLKRTSDDFEDLFTNGHLFWSIITCSLKQMLTTY